MIAPHAAPESNAMNFFGMGPMEVVVILVVALMIFGPGKLPEVAGQAGKMLRDLKKMSTDLSDEFEKTSGIGDIKKQVQKEMAGIQKEVDGVTGGVKKELTSATKTVNSATEQETGARCPLDARQAGRFDRQNNDDNLERPEDDHLRQWNEGDVLVQARHRLDRCQEGDNQSGGPGQG
ncbi:MAG: twin-arginine translocase TatA/TatE family subunit [Thermomicrobiales bacterium]